MGIFGGSYPPGAANDPFAPYNQDEPPCEVCGAVVDECECPECGVCGAQGNPACYVPGLQTHGLIRTMSQIHGAALREDEYWQQGQRDKAEGEYWAKHGTLDIDQEDVPQ